MSPQQNHVGLNAEERFRILDLPTLVQGAMALLGSPIFLPLSIQAC